MKHYEFPIRFRELFDLAVTLYSKGHRGADTFFNEDQHAYLARNGITAQYMYDYAEDQLGYGEPGFDHALSIEMVRRDYFLNVQHGRPSLATLDVSTMPGKTDAVRGIEWLPRIIPKARAKLRGELPPSLMYCCGGDRRFFKTHDILPAEFLTLVWRHESNDQAIIDWVIARSSGSR